MEDAADFEHPSKISGLLWSKSMIPIDAELLATLQNLWRIPPHGPNNLFSAPDFVALSELISERTGGKKIPFALANALKSLGLPCQQPAGNDQQPFDAQAVAQTLVEAFSRIAVTRRHLCPLDLADNLPALTFGRSKIARFSTSEIKELFDWPRLMRHFPIGHADANGLSDFHWLVIEEEVQLQKGPESRAFPLWGMDLSRDLGEIEPHCGQFPRAVEDALFFILLSPWEEWSTMNEVDWRGFRIPWVYSLDDDLCVAPSRPPNARDLSYEPHIYHDEWGEEIETERPLVLPLDDGATPGLAWVNDAGWAEVQAARATSLFETPVAHFLVRAFLANGIDEFLAHLTVIEAALGMESDHRKSMRPLPDPFPKMSATKRVAARLRAAVRQDMAAKQYEDLFNWRSAFIHGRSGIKRISTKQRLLARNLARRAVVALIELSREPVISRERVLEDLLISPPPAL